MRALARDLEVPPAYISRIFSGKQNFPIRRIQEIIKALDIDITGESELVNALIREQGIPDDLKSYYSPTKVLPLENLHTSSEHSYEKLSHKGHFLLDEWYYLAILDLSTCKGFHFDTLSVSQNLGLRPSVCEKAISRLKQNGFLVQRDDGSWRKTTSRIRFPATRSHESVRKFQSKMLQKAEMTMNKHISQEDFEKRFINGITLAVNSEKVDAAKKHLDKALFETIEILTEGDAGQVFHLATQLFPLSK